MTSSVTDIYHSFYEKIHENIKLVQRDYVGDKPNPKYQSDMMEEDEDFNEEFQIVYNDSNVL